MVETEKQIEESEKTPAARPPPPFLQRLKKKSDDRMYNKFPDMLSQIQLNLPLVDVLREIPKYAKYIKDIVANKRQFTEFETVELTEECTSRIQRKLPQKLKDPGSFTIPVRIANFIILDYEIDEHVPIILGRPLLETADAVIKVREGKMILRVDNVEAFFNVYKAIQLPNHYEDLAMISVIEIEEEKYDMGAYLDDSLEKALMLFDIIDLDDEVKEMVHHLDACAYIKGMIDFEPLDRQTRPPPSYIPVITRYQLHQRTTFIYPYGTYSFKRMSFGLCNVPATFQRCEETSLVLNWKKCHFMVREGIQHEHKVSKDGLEVDKAKVDAIEKLSKESEASWDMHISIVDSLKNSKISAPLCRLLEKDTPFKFDEHRLKAYEELKETELSPNGNRKFMHDVRFYLWDEPFLFKHCADHLVCRCVPEEEMEAILHDYHASPYGRHHGRDKITAKVLQSVFYWPILFKDAHAFVKKCVICQRTGTISRRHEMPLKGIYEVEIFDVWGIDFMGLFSSSNGHRYILLAVDYVSKWAEVVALSTNDAKVVVNFVKKNILTRFGTPGALISDRGTHFCNKFLGNLLANYGVRHKVTTAYHSQTSGQVEVLNREVKQILEKTVSASTKD
ncbi:uncharacterized protein LOC142168097 [Nicotiana tabacum]|uniref:Uncharacterized protein LOC142168097 n=1 Tax=Nicotiana tabacum TaxID=4097 RepID=A0AC58SIT1_TOBAC